MSGREHRRLVRITAGSIGSGEVAPPATSAASCAFLISSISVKDGCLASGGESARSISAKDGLRFGGDGESERSAVSESVEAERRRVWYEPSAKRPQAVPDTCEGRSWPKSCLCAAARRLWQSMTMIVKIAKAMTHAANISVERSRASFSLSSCSRSSSNGVGAVGGDDGKGGGGLAPSTQRQAMEVILPARSISGLRRSARLERATQSPGPSYFQN